MPVANMLESNDGALTRARISPLFGSMATIAPRLPARASVAILCRLRSIVRYRLCPGVGDSPSSMDPAKSPASAGSWRPRALVTTCRKPTSPCNNPSLNARPQSCPYARCRRKPRHPVAGGRPCSTRQRSQSHVLSEYCPDSAVRVVVESRRRGISAVDSRNSRSHRPSDENAV